MTFDPSESSRAAIRKHIADNAREAFARHVVTVETEDVWRCAEPGTVIYSFRVCRLPGAVLVYGDIGHLFLRPGMAKDDVLPWLVGASRSIDYLLEKAEGRHANIREFYPGLASQLLADRVDAHPDQVEQVRRAWSGDNDHHAFGSAFMDAFGDAEVIDQAWYWNSTALWCVEAIRWFVKHLPLRNSSDPKVVP